MSLEVHNLIFLKRNGNYIVNEKLSSCYDSNSNYKKVNLSDNIYNKFKKVSIIIISNYQFIIFREVK